MSKILYLTTFFLSVLVCAESSLSNQKKQSLNLNDNASPPQIGNFALPTSQQPGPLISFGQSIIERGKTQISLFSDMYKGDQIRSTDIAPYLIYAFSDKFSTFISLPVSAGDRDDENKSSGLEDASVQFEYAIFLKSNHYFTEQITVLSGLGLPTGSINKNPPTGTGALSFFLGTTYNRTYIDWFFFTSPGVNINSSHHGIHIGNTALYQFGLGRNLFTINSKLIIAGMVEVNGQYLDKNKILGIKNPDSGGNIIYILPSLWISTQKLIIQFGVGGVAYQHLFGDQNKNKYLFVGNLTWTL